MQNDSNNSVPGGGKIQINSFQSNGGTGELYSGQLPTQSKSTFSGDGGVTLRSSTGKISMDHIGGKGMYSIGGGGKVAPRLSLSNQLYSPMQTRASPLVSAQPNMMSSGLVNTNPINTSTIGNGQMDSLRHTTVSSPNFFPMSSVHDSSSLPTPVMGSSDPQYTRSMRSHPTTTTTATTTTSNTIKYEPMVTSKYEAPSVLVNPQSHHEQQLQQQQQQQHQHQQQQQQHQQQQHLQQQQQILQQQQQILLQQHKMTQQASSQPTKKIKLERKSQSGASDGNGNSCHQCKCSRNMGDIIFCMNHATDPCTLRVCRKKFCFQCLGRSYNMSLERVESLSEWMCPACLGLCTCAACKRSLEKTQMQQSSKQKKKQKVDELNKPSRPSKSKSKEQLNDHLKEAWSVERHQYLQQLINLQGPGAVSQPVAPIGVHHMPVSDEAVKSEYDLPKRKSRTTNNSRNSGYSASLSATSSLSSSSNSVNSSSTSSSSSSSSISSSNSSSSKDSIHNSSSSNLNNLGGFTDPLYSTITPVMENASFHDTLDEIGTISKEDQTLYSGVQRTEQPLSMPVMLPQTSAVMPTFKLPESVSSTSPLIFPSTTQFSLQTPTVFQVDDSNLVRLAAVDDAGWDLTLLFNEAANKAGEWSGQLTPLPLRVGNETIQLGDCDDM